MKYNKLSYLGFAGALALASCSGDLDTPSSVNNDGYLQINASINEIRTRATDTAFESGDQIGVSVKDATPENVNYTFNGNSFTSSSPIKLSGQTTFLAYYPYASDSDFDMDNGWKCSVVDKNNNPLPASQTDFMFAQATASKDNPTANFNFSHKMAQIALTIADKTNDGVYKDMNASVTLNNVAVEFTFWPYDGLVEDGNHNGTIKLSSVPVGTAKTIIVPSVKDGNEDAIEIVISVDGKGFQGKITPELKPGNRYSYTLNLNESDASVEADGTISDWTNNDEEDVDLEETEAPYELAVGDFLLTTGETVAPTSGNAATYSGKIAGIVYYVGTENLENFGYTVKNGLALAIDNAGQARWGSGNTDYSSWGKEGGHPENLGDLNISEMNVGSSGPKYEQIMGYNNTAVIKKAQQDFMDDDQKSEENKDKGYTHSKEMLELLEAANANKVTGASDWYLPNFSEFYIITQNLSTINAAIKLAKGTMLTPLEDEFVNTTKDGAVLTAEGYYWTSTLRGASNGWVSLLDNSDTEAFKNWSITRNSNSTKGYFRFAVAF